MSIIPPVRPETPPPEKRPIPWLAASLLAVLILLLAIASFFWTRLRHIDGQMQSASQRIEAVANEQESLNRDLMQSREQTRAAEQRAAKSELAQAQAAKQAEQAQSAKTLADQQVLRAEQESRNARQELEQIRKAREQELNRMQEALSKVVATRRTSDGLVIDLPNDSFKFDFDKATLRPENRELLSRLAGIFLVSHGYRLQIYGYTDDIGTDEYNQGLSERRAQAVHDYLAKSGIPLDMMTTKGFGKSSPRVKASSLEARERNRRVEIGVVDTVIKYAQQAQ
jgi:outer membrane protein OmpA-like peptidoglycan-associated protein